MISPSGGLVGHHHAFTLTAFCRPCDRSVLLEQQAVRVGREEFAPRSSAAGPEMSPLLAEGDIQPYLVLS